LRIRAESDLPQNCDVVYQMDMAAHFWRSSAPLITTIEKLFSEDLARGNGFLRQGNRILRIKLGRRVPFTEAPHPRFA
jgi:hypothetical protein